MSVEPWQPPEWIEPCTDLSFLPPWTCAVCTQLNTGWCRECGRCETTRPMDPLAASSR